MRGRRTPVDAFLLLLVAATSVAQIEYPRRVFVRAFDRTGATIPDLTAGDFTVTENGVARAVTRATLGCQPNIVAR